MPGKRKKTYKKSNSGSDLFKELWNAAVALRGSIEPADYKRYVPSGGDWKSIGDYLPMLKYGTQLPPPTKVHAVPPTPPPVLLSQLSQRVSVIDFDIPFGSVLKIMFKWMAAAFVAFCCFLPVIIILWLIIGTVVATLIGGAMSSLHHP